MNYFTCILKVKINNIKRKILGQIFMKRHSKEKFFALVKKVKVFGGMIEASYRIAASLIIDKVCLKTLHSLHHEGYIVPPDTPCDWKIITEEAPLMESIL